MNDPLKAWTERWRNAGEALEAIRRQELQNLEGAASPAAEILDGLLQWACENPQPRLSSGLVEQQRYFAKLRPRP